MEKMKGLSKTNIGFCSEIRPQLIVDGGEKMCSLKDMEIFFL
jgi:hypothetical protein